MDGLLTLLGLFCGGLLLVAPVASLLLALSARRRMAELDRRLHELEGQLLRLERARSSPRPSSLEPLLGASQAPGPAPVTAPPVAPPEPVAPPPTPVTAPPPLAPPEPVAPPPTPVTAPPPLAPPEPPRPSAPPLRFEQIAIRALAGLGGLGMVVAGFFFYDLAVERGIITPGVRYALGLGLGVILLVGAEALWRRDYRAPAAALSGSGLGVLYAALYAGVTRYELVGVPVTFALMAAVTAVSTLLAVRHGSLFLALLGAVGGFGTPVMLSTGENRAVALFSYLALLNLGLLVASSRRRWPALVLVAGLATLVIQWGWALGFHTSDQAVIGLVAPLLLGALFAAFAVQDRPAERTDEAAFAAASGALLALIPFLVPADPPLTAPAGLSTGATAWLGALALLLATGALLALARRRGWSAAALATVALASLGALVFAAGWSEEEAARWAVPALLVGLPALSLVIAPRGAAAPLAHGLAVGVLLVELALVTDEPALTRRWLEPLVAAGGLATVGFALALTRRWSWSPLVALGGLGLALLSVQGSLEARSAPEPAVLLGGVFTVIYLIFPFVMERFDAERREHGPWIAGALAGVAFFPAMYLGWEAAWGEAALGLLPALLGLASLGAVLGLIRRGKSTAASGDLALFTAVALLFLAAAIPIQLEDEWLTIGWALEVAALAWVRGRLTHRLLTPFALALAAAVSVRLLLNPEALRYHLIEGPPVLNWISYTWGVPALCLLYAAGRLPDAPSQAPAALRVVAILMLFALVNLQVSHGFAGEGDLVVFSDDFAEEMTRSLCWAAFGLLVLVAGVLARSRMIRIVAFLFLLLAAGKVFLSDLGSLGGLARVGSLVGLSVFLLVSATLFRWLDKKLEAEPPQEDA